MSMQVNTNSYTNTISGIYNNKTNLNSKNNTTILKTANEDTIEFTTLTSKKTMKEKMKKHGSGVLGMKYSYKGTINGENSKLTVDNQGKTIFAPHDVKGHVGDKNVDLTYKQNFTGSVCNYEGKIGNNAFNLKIEKKGFLGSNTKITGIIDGKPVEFCLKGGKVPEDKNTQDILTTILMLNGQEAKHKEGVFTGTKDSDWYRNEQAEAIAINSMQTQHLNTSYQPTWHYENPMAPTFY